MEAFLRAHTDKRLADRYCVLELGPRGEKKRSDGPTVQARPSVSIRRDLRGGTAEFEYLEGRTKGKKARIYLSVSGSPPALPGEVTDEDVRKWRKVVFGE